jgi:hypothetical protein
MLLSANVLRNHSLIRFVVVQHLRAGVMESALLASQCKETITQNSLPLNLKLAIRKKARQRIDEQYTRHQIARLRSQSFEEEQKAGVERERKRAEMKERVQSLLGGPIMVIVNGRKKEQKLPANTLLTFAQYEVCCDVFNWTKEQMLNQFRLRNYRADQRTEIEFEELSKLVPEITSPHQNIPLSGKKDALLKRLVAVLTAEHTAQLRQRKEQREAHLHDAGIDPSILNDADDDDLIDIDDFGMEIHDDMMYDSGDNSANMNVRRSERGKRPKLDPSMIEYD